MTLTLHICFTLGLGYMKSVEWAHNKMMNCWKWIYLFFLANLLNLFRKIALFVFVLFHLTSLIILCATVLIYCSHFRLTCKRLGILVFSHPAVSYVSDNGQQLKSAVSPFKLHWQIFGTCCSFWRRILALHRLNNPVIPHRAAHVQVFQIFGCVCTIKHRSILIQMNVYQ